LKSAGSLPLQDALLHKVVAVLAFGRQRFRLVHCADMHCLRVDVEDAHPIGVQRLLHDITAKGMKALLYFPTATSQCTAEKLLIAPQNLHRTCDA
jgi:hypothetical protein